MVKKALTLLTSLLIALHLLMPFNIYADTATVLGIDVSLISTNLLDTDSSAGVKNYFNQFIYNVHVELDNNYFGYILFHLDVSYYSRPQTTIITNNTSFNRKVFINGSSCDFNIELSSYYSTDPLLRNSVNGTPSVSIVDQGVSLLSELDSIQQIIDTLNDLYNSQDQVEGLLNNQLTQLQQVVSNTSLAIEYLEKISQMKEYDIPFESVPFVYYQYYQGLLPLELPNDTDHFDNYIVFQAPANQQIGNINTTATGNRSSVTLVIGTNVNVLSSNFYNYFGVDSSVFDISVNLLGIHYSGFRSFYINKIIISRKEGSSGQQFLNLVTSQFMYFIPIYFNYSYIKTLSTDFALRYGLSNVLLDNLNIIANGTTASQSAADSSQSANEQLQTDSNTLFQQEDGFKSDMNNAMQNVNTTFRLQDMGTKFVSSAQWVRTQYENLTNNTPFASLITFSLITGLALILLGKVYK